MGCCASCLRLFGIPIASSGSNDSDVSEATPLASQIKNCNSTSSLQKDSENIALSYLTVIKEAQSNFIAVATRRRYGTNVEVPIVRERLSQIAMSVDPSAFSPPVSTTDYLLQPPSSSSGIRASNNNKSTTTATTTAQSGSGSNNYIQKVLSILNESPASVNQVSLSAHSIDMMTDDVANAVLSVMSNGANNVSHSSFVASLDDNQSPLVQFKPLSVFS